MPEEGAKSSLGWRLIAVGLLVLLALVLGLMSYVFLPRVPPYPVSGVASVAVSTADGIREHVVIVAAAFLILGAATGLGYADKVLKPIAGVCFLALVFFVVAVWWTIRTRPLGGYFKG
jgi:hypothetical protein